MQAANGEPSASQTAPFSLGRLTATLAKKSGPMSPLGEARGCATTALEFGQLGGQRARRCVEDAGSKRAPATRCGLQAAKDGARWPVAPALHLDEKVCPQKLQARAGRVATHQPSLAVAAAPGAQHEAHGVIEAGVEPVHLSA